MSNNRVLYLDVTLPVPDRDTASQRTVQLLRHLVGFGFSVDFGAMFPMPGRGRPSTVRATGAELLGCHDEASLRRHIERSAHRYNAVVLSWTRVASRVLEQVRAANPDTFVVFDTVDLNHVREYRHARVTGNARVLRRAVAMKQHELTAAAAADCTLTVTEADADALRRACPAAEVHVVTVAVPPGPEPAPADGRHGVLFVGNYLAPHNVDTALHLARDVLTVARRELPGLTLCLAGANPPDEVLAIRSAGVKVPGYRRDIQPFLDRARVFACPLRFGAGIKGKLLLAMSAGVPVVASPMAAEGMELRASDHALIADSPEALAAAIVSLHRDDAQWDRISQAAREHVATRHNDAVVAHQLRRVFATRFPLVAAGRE